MTTNFSKRVVQAEQHITQRHADRNHQAHALAESATREEIDNMIERAVLAPDKKAFIKTAKDHELLLIQWYRDDYISRQAAAASKHQVSALLQRAEAASDFSQFLAGLSDVERHIVTTKAARG